MDSSNLSDYELCLSLIGSACESIDIYLDTLSKLYMLKNSTIEKESIKNEFLTNRIKFYEDEVKRVYEDKELCEKKIKKYVSRI